MSPSLDRNILHYHQATNGCSSLNVSKGRSKAIILLYTSIYFCHAPTLNVEKTEKASLNRCTSCNGLEIHTSRALVLDLLLAGIPSQVRIQDVQCEVLDPLHRLVIDLHGRLGCSL